MSSEKEVNVYLLDQLDGIERLEDAVSTGDLEAVKKELAIQKKQIERKLYQEPPISHNQ